MAMSLEQPLAVAAVSLEGEVATDNEAAVPVNPSPSGEHAEELTPNAALADPIGQLTIDTDAENAANSPTRRMSMSDASPPRQLSLRSRNYSADP